MPLRDGLIGDPFQGQELHGAPVSSCLTVALIGIIYFVQIDLKKLARFCSYLCLLCLSRRVDNKQWLESCAPW